MRETKEAKIANYPDRTWRRMMETFKTSRDAQISRDGEQFSELHQKHYDELLDKIIEIAERRR